MSHYELKYCVCRILESIIRVDSIAIVNIIVAVNTKLSSNLSFEDPLPAATHCNTLQHAATRCNTLQQHNLLLPDRARTLNTQNRSQKSLQIYRQSSTSAHSSFSYSQSLLHAPTRCNTLQHTATT